MPTEIAKDQLLRVHTPKYLKSLKWSAKVACIAEVPTLIFMPNFTVQSGYLRPIRCKTAGSILAGKLALEYGWAINLGGGFHHCCSVLELESIRVKQAMIIDLNVHQGNGHERDFKNVDSFYILDMYKAFIYPKEHDAKPYIRCGVEMRHLTEDGYYLGQLNRCLIQAVSEFKPDVVVYNAGTDVLKGDPLGNLEVTEGGVIKRDLMVFEWKHKVLEACHSRFNSKPLATRMATGKFNWYIKYQVYQWY